MVRTDCSLLSQLPQSRPPIYWALVPLPRHRGGGIDEIDGLAVAVRDLDMGEVWEDNAIPWELPITNRSDREIHILEFNACSCLTFEPRSVRIAPGDTARVRLALDLTYRTPTEIGEDRRSFRLPIYPMCRRNVLPQAGWVLRGIARYRVVLNATMIQFGEIRGGDDESLLRKVSATARLPVRLLSAKVDPPYVTAQVSKSPDANDRFELSIRPNSTLAPGPFQCEVSVEAITPGGDLLAGARLPVEGIVVSPVQAVPAQVLFGSHPVGCSIESTIRFQSRTDSAWKVEQWETDSPGLRVIPPFADELKQTSFRLVQRIVEAGDHKSVVRFAVRLGEDKSIVVPVEVSYHGGAIAEHPVQAR